MEPVELIDGALTPLEPELAIDGDERDGQHNPAQRCLKPLRSRPDERAIRWLFVAGFVLAVLAFTGLWLVGHDLIAFEVSVLSINWIVLVTSGALLSVVFRRAGWSTLHN